MTTTMTVREALGDLRSSTGLFVMRNLANRFRTRRDDPELERLVIVHKDLLRDKVSLAEIDQERARGWVRFHPETFCHRCGHRFEPWTAQNEDWNALMRGADGVESYGGIVCMACFQELWDLTPPRPWMIGWWVVRDEHGHLWLEAKDL